MAGTILRLLAAVGLLFAAGSGFGHSPQRTDLLSPDTFLSEAFAGQVPEPERIWMIGDVARWVEQILCDRPRWPRLPYWKQDGRTAWVLEENLDGAPVTVGVVVEGASITQMRVLVYGARHGRDVTTPGFLSQFEGASLHNQDKALDRPIRDAVGMGRPAELMVGLARLALFLTDQIPVDLAQIRPGRLAASPLNTELRDQESISQDL